MENFEALAGTLNSRLWNGNAAWSSLIDNLSWHTGKMNKIVFFYSTIFFVASLKEANELEAWSEQLNEFIGIVCKVSVSFFQVSSCHSNENHPEQTDIVGFHSKRYHNRLSHREFDGKRNLNRSKWTIFEWAVLSFEHFILEFPPIMFKLIDTAITLAVPQQRYQNRLSHRWLDKKRHLNRSKRTIFEWAVLVILKPAIHHTERNGRNQKSLISFQIEGGTSIYVN